MNPDPTTRAPEGETPAPEADQPQAPADGAPGSSAGGAPGNSPGGFSGPEAAVASDEPAEAFELAGEELEALAAKAGKAEEYLALAQRTQADFENFRKRAARDAAIASERGATKLALALLPAVDNLERALAHAPAEAEGDEDGFVSGIKHVHSDVLAALEKAGIERFSPEGERFDPQLHEAVAQQPVEGYEPGTVVEVFQRGYRMGDSVVRPARVVVAG